jgi:hypothetical protein
MSKPLILCHTYDLWLQPPSSSLLKFQQSLSEYLVKSNLLDDLCLCSRGYKLAASRNPLVWLAPSVFRLATPFSGGIVGQRTRKTDQRRIRCALSKGHRHGEEPRRSRLVSARLCDRHHWDLHGPRGCRHCRRKRPGNRRRESSRRRSAARTAARTKRYSRSCPALWSWPPPSSLDGTGGSASSASNARRWPAQPAPPPAWR